MCWPEGGVWGDREVTDLNESAVSQLQFASNEREMERGMVDYKNVEWRNGDILDQCILRAH